MPFELAGNIRSNWYNYWTWHYRELLNGVTQMITDRLVANSDYLLIERTRIDAVFMEQNLQQTDSFDLSSAVSIGRLLGVDILVLGSLTDFSITSKGGVQIGKLSLGGTQARTALTARLVDVQKGQILSSIEAEGINTGVDVSVKNLQGLSFGSQGFTGSIIDKSLEFAVDDFVLKFNKAFDDAMEKLGKGGDSIGGEIVGIEGNYIIINIGRTSGITMTTKFNVYRLTQIPGVSEPVRLPVGTLRVISIDDEVTVTMILNEVEGFSIEVGDVVEIE